LLLLLLLCVWVVLPLQLYTCTISSFYKAPSVWRQRIRKKWRNKKKRAVEVIRYLIDGIEYWLAYTRPKEIWWWYDEEEEIKKELQ
jgi:hypothetical protein